MENNYFWVEIELKQKERFMLKCFKMRVSIFETKEEGNKLFVKIKAEDFKKMKHIWFVKIKKKDVTGVLKLKNQIKKHHIFLLACIFGIGLLFFLSRVMVKVEVIHSKKEIRDLVSLTLEEKGIKKNTLRKSYEEIEKIKKEILNEYPEKLEWIEIETNGMNYIVRVEERKIETMEEEKKSCHIIATKDGIIKNMIFKKGEAEVQINDSVKKGDILVRGIIKKDEIEKGTVCASGEIYAEVWYHVSVSLPMEYVTTKRTGKKRWNIRYRNSYYDDFIFRSRLQNYEEEKTPIFRFLGQEISFVTQYEVEKIKNTYSKEEAEEIAIKEALAKITSTLKEKEEIIDKKVLKKEEINSTMNIEVFVSVKESIGEVQEFEWEPVGE